MSHVRATNLRVQLPDSPARIQNCGTPARGRGAVPAAPSCNCGTPVAVRETAASRWDPRFYGQMERFFTPDLAIVHRVTQPSTTLRREPGLRAQISPAMMPQTM